MKALLEVEYWSSAVISEGGTQPEMFLRDVLLRLVAPPPLFPALYIKNTFSPSVVCLLWELRFKSLTNMFVCWTAETTSVSALPLSSDTIRWDWRREEGPRTQGAELRHLLLKKTKQKKTDVNASVSQFTCNRRVVLFLFFRGKFRWNVCVVSRRLYCWTIVPTASVFAASPSEPSPVRFFIGCPGSFTNLLKMQRCWPFEWDSQIFFYMIVFVWRI